MTNDKWVMSNEQCSLGHCKLLIIHCEFEIAETGDHTPLACRFRRLAGIFVQHSDQIGIVGLKKNPARRRLQHE